MIRTIPTVLFLCMMFWGIAMPLSEALAQNDQIVGKKEKYKSDEYSPLYCEFTATFPEEPYVTHRCEDPKDAKTCYDLISYTKVFDVTATVRVNIICNPSTEKMYEQLTPEAMKTTVRAMTKGSVIESYEVGAREDENYRQAGLVGKGRNGMDETIYIAQLWSGKKSIMSVEAELMGQQMDEADNLYAAILQSIGYIGDIKPEIMETPEKTTDDSAKNVNP